jgi:hypothetical protein
MGFRDALKYACGVCCAAVAVCGLERVFALEKIRDKEYMRTVYQFDTEDDTKSMVLAHAYSGDTEEVQQENPHDGFEMWKNDCDYLMSSSFREKFLTLGGLSSCKSEFKIWLRVTLVSSLFEDSWSPEDGAESVCCVKRMLGVYKGWIKGDAPGRDFVLQSIADIETLADRSSTCVYHRRISRK